MKWSNEGKWITVGFGLILILIGLISVSSYQNATQLVESANRVRQTNDILDSFTDVSAALADAESRQWSYLILNEPQELQQYSTAIAYLDPILNRLEAPLSDTPVQKNRLAELQRLIERQIDLFSELIEQYRGNVLALTNEDPLIIEIRHNQTQIRQLIDRLEQEEEALLEEQMKLARTELQFRMIIEPLGTLLTFAILFMVYGLLLRQMVKRQQAEALQRTWAQQKELSEMKLQFFSMVSHEFRTPLSLILGSAQLLDEALKPIVDLSKLKNLYRIQSAARSMTRLLNDVLMLARADAGKLEFRPEMIELQTFCLNLIEDLKVFTKTQHSIQFIKRGTGTHARVDEKLLYSILTNLLSNAMKYSQPVDTIEFLLETESDRLIFKIKDHGIGIPPEDQEKLYQLFSRGRNAQDIRGTGLGLAVVKTCVDLHHGQIFVDSMIGVGTTFTVVIPQPF